MPLSQAVLDNAQVSRGMLNMLLKDVGDEQMTAQPAAGMNHPAWIVGHLACSWEFVAQVTGADYRAPEGWNKLFGMGSKPTSDRARYPGKEALLAELDRGDQVVTPVAAKLSDEALAAVMPLENFRRFLPTVEHGLVFGMTGHYLYHLGQLSGWRRAMGLPSAMGV